MCAAPDHHGWGPQICVWEITRACNLRCGHCGSLAGRPRDNELALLECQGVVEELAALSTRNITFSGGEPTLREDWPHIGRYASALGISVSLVTNGQTDANALAANARASGLTHVAVSLDGLESTQDLLRGTGTFQRATNTIQVLAMAGIATDVMVTIHHKSLPELDALHAVASRLGARRMCVQLRRPSGYQRQCQHLTLQPRPVLALFPLLARLNRSRELPVHFGDSTGYFSIEERQLRGDRLAQGHFTGRYAGCRAIWIQSDGGVKGCQLLQPYAGAVNPFIEGNLREESLKSMHQHAPRQALAGARTEFCTHSPL